MVTKLSYEERFTELSKIYQNIYELIKLKDDLGDETLQSWGARIVLENAIESLTQIANRQSLDFSIEPEIILQGDK